MCTMVYFSHLAMSKGEGALHHDPPFKIRCLVQWYTKPDIWARDIWAQRHLGAKCVLAHFQQSFSTSKKTFLQKFYIFNGVSALIFCNFLITTSNKRTNWLMYITET